MFVLPRPGERKISYVAGRNQGNLSLSQACHSSSLGSGRSHGLLSYRRLEPSSSRRVFACTSWHRLRVPPLPQNPPEDIAGCPKLGFPVAAPPPWPLLCCLGLRELGIGAILAAFQTARYVSCPSHTPTTPNPSNGPRVGRGSQRGKRPTSRCKLAVDRRFPPLHLLVTSSTDRATASPTQPSAASAASSSAAAPVLRGHLRPGIGTRRSQASGVGRQTRGRSPRARGCRRKGGWSSVKAAWHRGPVGSGSRGRSRFHRHRRRRRCRRRHRRCRDGLLGARRRRRLEGRRRRRGGAAAAGPRHGSVGVAAGGASP